MAPHLDQRPNSEFNPYGNVPAPQTLPAINDPPPVMRQEPIVQTMQPSVIPPQMAKDFFNVVKKGNINEIINAIETCQLDVTKLVDDNFRHTALFYCSQIKDPNASFEVIKMLVEKGVPATYTDILNQNVLYYIAREGNIKACLYLLDLGCEINHRDQYGQSPLYYAAREGHNELAIEFLKMGADVNVEDNMGQTAIFYSAREGHLEMCKVLLDHGCNVNKSDKKRQTPLHWAKKHNRHDVIELLLSRGANPIKKKAQQA
eukprot:TRINITY_DN1440_c0_g1_i4.p1 TRINITY_DN1440_c0_g1~~TRINITY_DN1440_c0_g1_i4.p1  ORF type:complete len:290 (-),score=24.91 TRINITY_DN1440_c0_g1_i4:8-787(-)